MSETNAFKRIAPASSETKILARTVSESSRGCEPSRLPIDPGDLCGGIVLIFSEGSLPPGEKIASLQIPRPEIRRISAESEKGWRGGESVPSAPGRDREGRSPLELPIKRISAGNHILFRGGGSGGGACSPVHLTRTACTSSSDSARAGTHHRPLPRPARSRRRSCPRFRPSRARACRGSWRRACRRECRW